MEPLVINYLKTHSLKQLYDEYGIENSAKDRDSFYSLNYSQLKSKPGFLTNQCRGLILATKNGSLNENQISGNIPVGETYVMALPFSRFFNYGDSTAAQVDFNDPETVFYEKRDGTMCLTYYNDKLNQWCVATRSVPLADKLANGWKDMTFRKLFEKALYDTLLSNNMIEKNSNPEIVFNVWAENNLSKNDTHIFELTTPLNLLVVEYSDYRIHLLGIRDTQTGKEIDLKHIVKGVFFGVPICPSYKLNNLQEVLDFVNGKNPTEQEGLVVKDKNFNRAKIKSLAYMAYNKIKDGKLNSPRGIMELILSEKFDDIMPILDPFMQEKAMEMQNGLRELIKKTDEHFEFALAKAIHDIETFQMTIFPETAPESECDERKEFALNVKALNGWMAPLMERYTGKCKNTMDYIQKRKDQSINNWKDSFLDMLIQLSSK